MTADWDDVLGDMVVATNEGRLVWRPAPNDVGTILVGTVQGTVYLGEFLDREFVAFRYTVTDYNPETDSWYPAHRVSVELLSEDRRTSWPISSTERLELMAAIEKQRVGADGFLVTFAKKRASSDAKR